MTTMQIERRAYDVTEFRAVKDGLKIVGHAAVFNKLSEDLGGFREQVARGAFAQTIAEDDIRALFNHNPDLILGRNRSGTLALSEDETGLMSEITLPDTQLGRDLLTSIERGDVSGMSFSFRTIEDAWELVDGMEIRTLRRVRLFDVSPVAFPAYPQTDIAKRSLDEWRKAQEPKGGDGRKRRQQLAEMEG